MEVIVSKGEFGEAERCFKKAIEINQECPRLLQTSTYWAGCQKNWQKIMSIRKNREVGLGRRVSNRVLRKSGGHGAHGAAKTPLLSDPSSADTRSDTVGSPLNWSENC